jgi:hypothetical protein
MLVAVPVVWSAELSAVHKMTPVNRNPLDLVCNNQTAISVVLDVTGSMGDAPRLLWDKIPLLLGELVTHD